MSMKRISITFALLVSCVLLYAKSDLQLQTGSTSFLKESVFATVEMDWSKATWEKYRSIQKYCGDDYEERFEISVIAFAREFNSNSKGLRITESEDAKYKIVIRMEDFEQNSSGTGWGRFYIRLYGTLEVIDLSTGNSVAKFIIDGVNGGADYVQTDRFAKSFAKLGKTLAKKK